MSHSLAGFPFRIPIWDSIAAPKFLLNAAKIWLFVCAASCVRLKEKTGVPSLLTGFMISLLIVVTSHVTLEFCFLSNLLLMIFAICIPLSKA